MKRMIWLAFGLVLVASNVWSQQMADLLVQESGSLGEGWRGFTDLGFLINTLLTLSLAAILGAAIAFHPKNRQTADTLEEIEAPKVYITYAVTGALIGIMVIKYGLVVGFVLFGIGGLIRFRTILRSANLTSQAIFVTLIGLSCGLDMPHVAVLATAFGFVLIYTLNARLIYRINVRAIPPERIVDAAAMYRQILEEEGCLIMSEKKSPEKSRITFIFRSGRNGTRQHLEDLLETRVEPPLKGYLDWEID